MLASFLSVALAGALLPLAVPTHAGAQTYMLGIDVSHHQDAIDWDQVAQSGQAFAWAKATEGATHSDPRYAENRGGAGAASIPFGAYHFAYAQGATRDEARTDAISEASYFLQVAQPEPGDLLPVLDLEKNPQDMPPRRLIAWTQAWLDTVTASLGVKPMIYTGPNFWATDMNDTTTFADQDFPLWIAHYTSDPAPRVPAGNWGGRGWAFWQFTSSATVPGITGPVDQNRYPGSDLTPYTIPGAPEPEPTPEPATPPSNASPPVVSGTPELARTLTASTGTWNGSEPLSYSYAWFRCMDATNCSGIVGGTQPSYQLQAADVGHRMKVEVTATNSAGFATSASALTDVVVEDATAPVAPSITHPRRARVLATDLVVRWTQPEADLLYDLRYRSAGRDGDFGRYRRIATATPDASASSAADPGTTYCFSARAVDQAGNRSAWSTERCTLSPLDDRDLRPSAGWSTRSRDVFYRDTFTKTKRRRAALVIGRTKMRSIHVLAQRCPGCGKVKVLLNGSRVGTVSLDASRIRNRSMLHVATFSRLRDGKVRLVVVSRGAPVKVDGLALTIKV